MWEQRFIQIISGQAKGILPALGRGLLWLCSWPYGFAMWFRNRRFDLGFRGRINIDVPVIAVGNLTTGGTGKTPVVAWIVQQLQAAGHSPGIVSRGYGADESGVNDEKRVLELLCAGVPHEQHPDRVTAANRLINQHHVNVIVCDDAFQHRRIARNLNIVLIDATNPFGYGHLLPRGLLREPVGSLRRADLVLITRSDCVTESTLLNIESQVSNANSQLKSLTFRITFRPTTLLDKAGDRRPLSDVRGQPVTLMTGIGNPDAFEMTCRQLGALIAAKKFFPDHHLYNDDDLNEVRRLAQTSGAELILTTLKDLVKIQHSENNLWAVHVESAFDSADAATIVRDKLTSAARLC